LLPVVFTNSTINQGCSGRINSSCSISVTRRVTVKAGMLRKDRRVTLMEQDLLFLPENPWFIVEFVNTTGNTNGAGNINPSGASLVYSRVRGR
jgi:hypothetical protein